MKYIATLSVYTDDCVKWYKYVLAEPLEIELKLLQNPSKLSNEPFLSLKPLTLHNFPCYLFVFYVADDDDYL